MSMSIRDTIAAIHTLRKAANALAERAARLQARLSPGAAAFIPVRVQGGTHTDRLADTVAELTELAKRHRGVLNALGRHYRTIDAIEDKALREIIVRRYLEDQHWSRIAEEMGYSSEQVPRRRAERFLARDEARVKAEGGDAGNGT